RQPQLRCRTHLAGVGTLTRRVYCRHHVVVRRTVRHPSVGVAGRGRTGDGRVWTPAGGRALHVVTGRPTRCTPAQPYLSTPPRRRQVRRRPRRIRGRPRTVGPAQNVLNRRQP